MKMLPLVLLSLLLTACAGNPEYAAACRDATGCGSVVVNPNFGPIQGQAVAPDRPGRLPF